MKFGRVDDPESIDFTLPEDHPDTLQVCRKANGGQLEVFVGCAKWNRQELKNFYPRGTKDELAYYSTQFNCIELNATFYREPSSTQVIKWREKTPPGFKFFPKITNTISHFKRLQDVDQVVDSYCDAIVHFEEKLGSVFLQMHENFAPKQFDHLHRFIERFPGEIPLAVEVRNAAWFDDSYMDQLSGLLRNHGKTNIIVDTAGRRDMMHMRLTSPSAFVRYVGANHKSDYRRLDDWVDRIKTWQEAGLQQLNFFVHQNIELESPLLSAYFVRKLNEQLGINLKVPDIL